MGRRKRRRPRPTAGASTQPAKNDPDESFDLEIVDDRKDTPHPLDEVSAALDVGTAVDPAASRAELERSAEAVRSDAAADPESRTTRTRAGGEDAVGRAGTGTLLQARLAVDEAPAGSDSAVTQAEPAADVQTLGELLQQARESRGLSVEETSARTRISLKMLGHLENDRFGEFAADAYAKGFLRNYGNFLGLDVDMLVRRYETLAGQAAPAAPAVWEEVVEPRRRRRRWKPKRRTWVGVTVTLVVAALIWVFWSRGAAKLGLRPTPGLQQIENELRAAPPPAPIPLADPVADLPGLATDDETASAAATTDAGASRDEAASPTNAAPAPKPTAPKSTPAAPRSSTPEGAVTPRVSPTRQETKKRSTEAVPPHATAPATPPKPKPETKPATKPETKPKPPEDSQPPAPKPRATRPATRDDAKRPPPPEPADPPGAPRGR